MTNQQTVDLSLSASGAVSMMISESSTFEGASYESYAISKSFTLSSGDGNKDDLCGNIKICSAMKRPKRSVTVSYLIPLHRQTACISINSGATITNNTSVTLTLSATGASEMMISEDSSFSEARL